MMDEVLKLCVKKYKRNMGVFSAATKYGEKLRVHKTL